MTQRATPMEDAPFPTLFQPLSDELQTRFPRTPAEVQQSEPDMDRAYEQALDLSNTFLAQLTRFGGVIQQRAEPRPGGIKSRERALEKASLYGLVPLDLLAGKYVFHDLRTLYEAARRIEEVFLVSAFQDRFLRPQASGYRDLQFVVEVEGLVAEVKFCHAAFDELDSYEHRLYEVRRVLEAKNELSVIERLVLDSLNDTSTLLFQQVWAMVSREAGG